MRLNYQSAVACLAAVGVFAAASEARAANPPCNAVTDQQSSPTALPGSTNYVIFEGSTAAKPMLKSASQLLAKLTPSIRLIYVSVGSCQGMSDFTTTTKTQTVGTYWDETHANAELSCDTTNPNPLGMVADVGISDVFPTSCNGVTLPASQANFNGSAQIFNFIVPPSSSQNAISEEAAFVIFGWGGVTNTVAPWTDVTKIFLRDPTKSGTYAMLTKLIGLDPTKIKGTIPGAGKSPDVESAVHNADATTPNAAIGVLSSDYADKDRSGATQLKILAYQHKGAACAVYPDSKGGPAGTLDKYNVRTGNYPFWGPIHYVASVDGSGNPVAGPNASAVTVTTALSYFTRRGLTDPTALQSMIDYEVVGYTVPLCAMQVNRSADVAPIDSGLVPYVPDTPCHCYYEFKATGATGITGIESSCASCTNDGGCSGSTPKCRYGYCEAK